MILTCLFEFETHSEGLTKMQNFEYPCAFIVGNDMYDYEGNVIVITENYYIAPNRAMDLVIGFGNEDTLEGYSYVHNNICKVNKPW